MLILLLAFGARSLGHLPGRRAAGRGRHRLAADGQPRPDVAGWRPRSRQAEFFGFYAVAGRVSAVIGPLLFGAISSLTGNQRLAILALLVMIVRGLRPAAAGGR